MSDNVVLERLREIRDILGSVRDDMADAKHRLTTLGMQVGSINATGQNHYASLSGRLDRIGGDVDRIKRRLDIADAPAH